MESQGPRFFVRGQHGSTSSLEVIAVACRFWPVLCQLSTCTWNAFPHWNSFVKQIRKTMGTNKMVSFLISSTSFSFQTKKIWMIQRWLNIIASVYPPWTVSHFYHLWILTGSERVLSLSKGLIFESAMAFSTDFTRAGANQTKGCRNSSKLTWLTGTSPSNQQGILNLQKVNFPPATVLVF